MTEYVLWGIPPLKKYEEHIADSTSLEKIQIEKIKAISLGYLEVRISTFNFEKPDFLNTITILKK